MIMKIEETPTGQVILLCRGDFFTLFYKKVVSKGLTQAIYGL